MPEAIEAVAEINSGSAISVALAAADHYRRAAGRHTRHPLYVETVHFDERPAENGGADWVWQIGGAGWLVNLDASPQSIDPQKPGGWRDARNYTVLRVTIKGDTLYNRETTPAAK